MQPKLCTWSKFDTDTVQKQKFVTNLHKLFQGYIGKSSYLTANVQVQPIQICMCVSVQKNLNNREDN